MIHAPRSVACAGSNSPPPRLLAALLLTGLLATGPGAAAAMAQTVEVTTIAAVDPSARLSDLEVPASAGLRVPAEGRFAPSLVTGPLLGFNPAPEGGAAIGGAVAYGEAVARGVSAGKAPGRAVLYSAGGTALLLPAGGVGLVVGPAFGHFYAGDAQQAWTGIAIRSGGAFAVGVGGVLALGAPRVGWGLLTIGALVVSGSALFDIVTAWHSAQDYNEAHGLSARVAPAYRVAPAAGPRSAPVGLALHVSL